MFGSTNSTKSAICRHASLLLTWLSVLDAREQQLAKGLITELSPKYLQAKQVGRERKKLTGAIERDMFACPPRPDSFKCAVAAFTAVY